VKIHQLSIVFNRRDVKLIGPKDLVSSNELYPGLGMNITLTFCQDLGIKPKSKSQASREYFAKWCNYKRVGKIPFPPAVLWEPNTLIAHLIFSSVITEDAINQSSVDEVTG
jgi:hypothetical protein